jgi:hypothetical protein
MRVGRDYAWWVSCSWTYEWLEEESGEWISDRDSESERFYCNKKDIKKEAEKKAIEEMAGLKYRNLKVTINDFYKTTIEEI